MLAGILDEDYEIDTDELVELPELEATHRELIDESIKEQIEDPFESSVNFVDEYFTELEKQIERCDENPDLKAQIITDGKKFCQEVIKMVDAKYSLDIDDETIEEMDLESLMQLTYGIYDFFVVHYPKNLKKFFIKYIIQNIDVINEALMGSRDVNDVMVNSLKTKLNDERAARIIANLRTVIDYIDDLDLDGLEVLGYYNPERYDIYVLTNAIHDMTISENFVRGFFQVLTNSYEDDHYTEIYIAIESGLIKKFKRADIN